MQNLAPQLFAILAKYQGRDDLFIDGSTRLDDLGIDELDLPMVMIDIEDALGIAFDGGHDPADIETAADLLAVVNAAISTRLHQPHRSPSRKKSSWMSTNAGA